MNAFNRIQTWMSRGWVIAALVSLSYLLAFMQRTGPGVIANHLQQEFRVSSTMLGTMTSIQYLLYMILQIPVGLFGDRFGPEKLLVSGVVLDGIGTLVFSDAHSYAMLLTGRAVVGLGDALIWVNIVLILGKRFAPQVFGSLLGIVGTCGNIGAVLTTLPFAAWVAMSSWRIPFGVLAWLLIGIAVLDWVSLGTPNKGEQVKKMAGSGKLYRRPTKDTLVLIVRDQNSWATFACHFGACGTYIGFVSLWAVPYFHNVYRVSQSGATLFTLCAFVGAILGGPIVGALSDKMGSRKMPYIFLQGLATMAWSTVPAFHGAPPSWLAYVFMFVIGFVSGGSLLTFAVIRDQIPSDRAGVASGFANTGGFLSAVLLPVLFGGVMDWLAPHVSPGQLPTHVYAIAFIVPTLSSFIGLIGSLAIVETKAK